jgi:hypothetical protein
MLCDNAKALSFARKISYAFAGCYTDRRHVRLSHVKGVGGIATSNGDLNNTLAARVSSRAKIDPAFAFRSLAIPVITDDELVRQKYGPFLLDPAVESSDWVSRLELATAAKMAQYDIERTGERLRALVLSGSRRKRYDNLSAQKFFEVSSW